MNTVTDLELRRFFHAYLDKVMDKAKNHVDYDINKNNFHLHSEDGKLALGVLNFMCKLKDLLADLNKIEVFIRRFPDRKFYEENDIDQLEYIRYHYEVFIHKIHTILEIKKLTINSFYKIGLKEKDCNWVNLKNHKQIKNSAVACIIENYFKTFEHIIKHRHLNTHRAYFGDKKNDELKVDLMIYKNSEKFGYEVGEAYKSIMPKFVLEHKIKKYRKERLEYIKSGIEAANEYVHQFENIILLEFFKTIKN